MARCRDDGEVQIDTSTNGRFRNAFQWLIVSEALNVGALLILRTEKRFTAIPFGPGKSFLKDIRS
jgi:hypothetical protein